MGVLLPTSCPICGARGPAPCRACREALPAAPPLPPLPGLDAVVAVFAYEDGARELVARLKYRNARSSIPFLARRLAELAPAADAVTWVPTTRQRRDDRGFDHARLLAVATGRRLGRPARRLLVRAGGPAQTGRSAAERRSAPPVFKSAPRVPKRVLLIDDVVTTGSTVTAAAVALRAGGAVTVTALVVARTPPRGRGC